MCLGFLSITLFLVVAKVWMINSDSGTVLQGPRVKFVALFEIEKKIGLHSVLIETLRLFPLFLNQ